MKTLDIRRRKRPLSLNDLLVMQNRQYCKRGRGDIKVLLTEAQQDELYALLQSQVRFSSNTVTPFESAVRFRGMAFEVRA